MVSRFFTIYDESDEAAEFLVIRTTAEPTCEIVIRLRKKAGANFSV